MKLGILGKPQSGKTTVFNAAANQQEAVGDFSQAVHRALITVPDSRVDELAAIVQPKKITYAQIEFLDAPGLSGKGKDSGGMEISDDLRQTDSFVMVVDGFSPDATPKEDIQLLIQEMIVLDYVLLESVYEKRERKVKLTGDKTGATELELIQRCLKHLEAEQPILDMVLDPAEQKLLRGYQLLSAKPALIVVNIAEDDITRADEIEAEYKDLVDPGKREVAVFCGKIQMELVGLDDDEREEFMADLGIKVSATDRVIQKSYDLLGLISFLTAGDPEVRAWTITKGTKAPQAAGVIHSDIERGFIRAEVTPFADYVELKTAAAIKAAGKQRLEGKEYVVKDGDVILFRFNV